MPLLILCFVLFFGVAEVYPLVQGIVIPMPLYIAAGILLAIASNSRHGKGLPWQQQISLERSPQPASGAMDGAMDGAIEVTPLSTEATTPQPVASQATKATHKATSQAPKTLELPRFDFQSRKSISFTIRPKRMAPPKP